MTITTVSDAYASTTRAPASYDLGYLWRISVVAAMGGLLFGYDMVVIGGAKPFFEAYFSLDGEATRGWANSCAIVGCLVGSIISGALSDQYGRKRLLLLAGILFAVSSVLTGWARTFEGFVLWRIVGGVAIGLASNLSPMYIAEVTPAEFRGRLVSLNQLTIVLGVLGAQVVNWFIAETVPQGLTVEMMRESWNGQYGWRWMFTAVAVPSLVFLVGALWVPESPRWLVRAGERRRAHEVLTRIGGVSYADSALEEIQSTLTPERFQRISLRELLEPRIRAVVAVGVVLAVLQQWCGINVIFSYAEEVFRDAGYGLEKMLLNIVITGIVLVLFTFVAILKVDQFGRRGLLLVGCAGIGVLYVLVGFSYQLQLPGLVIFALLLGALACYSFSLAPVTWVLISEIFPNRIRGLAVSVAVSALWIASFILIYTFPLLNHVLGAEGTFWLYAGICSAGFVFILKKVPETKGKSLEEVERELGGRGHIDRELPVSMPTLDKPEL